jgi:hypothetical protein
MGSADKLNKTSLSNALGARLMLTMSISFLLLGCGAIAVHHVPKFTVSASKMSDLRGAQPIDIKAGEASSTETNFGSAGMGRVVGKLSDWTEATVGAIRTNLVARGATITPGAAKTLTVTMTHAEVHGTPVGAHSKVVLTAAASGGPSASFEGSHSSMAPLGSVDGAVEDAVKKLLADPAIDAYLHK